VRRQPNVPRRERLGWRPQLDGVRALAALAVVGFHAWGDAVPGGGIGVDVFFVLSGFLITTLLLEEHARFGDVSLPAFYLRRAVRLLPPLAAMLIGAALYATFVVADPNTVRGVFAATVYSSDWLMALHGAGVLGLLYPTWSLAVEEQFYLLWPALLLLLLRLGRERLLFGAAMLGVALAVAERAALVAHGVSTERLLFAPDTRADALLAGCALAAARQLGWLDSVPRRIRTAAAAVGALVLLARLGAPAWPFPYLPYGMATTTAGSVLLIAGILDGGRIASALSHRALVRLGGLSYAIYLWHPLVLDALHHIPVMSLGPLRLLLTLTAAIALAELSRRVVERPAAALRVRWRRRVAVAAAAV
jgi:peptidoglycan/LPS O-acetylase OafA/YrhL